MNTCDTCKWWGPLEFQFIFSDDQNRRICGHPKILNGYEFEEVPDATDIHKSIDSSLVTGPKFGCIHHEMKWPPGLKINPAWEDAPIEFGVNPT